MTLCVFEDRAVANLEPLTLTRPAFELWCGAGPLLNRQQRAFGAKETGAVVRPELAALCRRQRPEMAINDTDWLRRQPRILVNARWLPPGEPIVALGGAHVGHVGEEVAFVVLPTAGVPDLGFENLEEVLARLKSSLPRCDAGGALIGFPWELIDLNGPALGDDVRWLTPGQKVPDSVAVIGPRERLIVDKTACVEPFVAADTRGGPVILDRGAVVQSFSRLEGPCYVGPESAIHGAKLRGGTIGPKCHIGGEVEASIVHGFTNKYHDGFLGHSYVGEWVNLAAGTQTSDLRNDYGPIRVAVGGVRMATGRIKVGSFLGDHTKTGLNMLLNCGTSAGVFCNLLPTGTYLPTAIPSFTLCSSSMKEQAELQPLLETAATVMRRRGGELTDAHRDLYTHLFTATRELRSRMYAEFEQRRLRRGL